MVTETQKVLVQESFRCCKVRPCTQRRLPNSRQRSKSLPRKQRELLRASAGCRLARVDVALRIDRQVVQ